jgi:hypothetical protein
MILISHRGNIEGPNKDKENSTDYIEEALKLGFDVEIDVWCDKDNWYLGHDSPKYKIKLSYLKNKRLWCHAKNIEALERMTSYSDIHSFWHQEDDVTLTSRNFLWTYPGKPLTSNSICVKPESGGETPKNVLGICSDYINRWRKNEEK